MVWLGLGSLMVFEVEMRLACEVLFIYELHRFLCAALKIMQVRIHRKALYLVRLVPIWCVIIVISYGYRRVAVLIFSIKPLKPSLEVPLRISTWVAHGHIIFLARRSLVSVKDLPLVLRWENIVEIVAQKLISSHARMKLLMILLVWTATSL